MIFADTETDGLLDALTKIHCIVLMRDGLIESYHDHEDIEPRTGSLEEGVDILEDKAEEVCFHNAHGFDGPALNMIFPALRNTHRFVDSLIAARAALPDPSVLDYKNDRMPKELIGRHSLKAWGYRLGLNKSEIETDWAEFTEEMLEYCIQDVKVLAALWEYITAAGITLDSYRREERFAFAISGMEKNGFAFDEKEGALLQGTLAEKRTLLDLAVLDAFPPHRIKKYKRRPKKFDSSIHEVDDEGFTWKIEAFNPQSRLQIAAGFKDKYKWEPTLFTPAGSPLMDEVVLRGMPYPEARLFAERLRLQKQLGMLAEGKQAWMRLSKDGRIHCRVQHSAARTHRCSHSHPNLAQVDKDPTMRGLFVPSKGNVLVGIDLSGLELRCLAHYMDDKDYTSVLLNGDIHTHNMKAWEVEDRDLGKRLTYACLYGGGDALLGDITGGGQTEGKRARKRFLANLPALARLIKDAQKVVKTRGWLRSLDGRPTYSPDYAALNSLLQSAGAIIAKEWVGLLSTRLPEEALLVAMVHDEVQIDCPPALAEEVGTLCVEAAEEAGRNLNMKLPITAEFQVGNSWANTH